ncbi:hypothetical protein H920_02764 [Fukomys damarensis]|uniref:Uncharacterized protein n=1 Tax=Fukomys damarensis TaxID=885580 RepID=A0A091DUJ2_FUKDA|nr:hypothetical protein H920_02764 [Fukomys damarensis]
MGHREREGGNLLCDSVKATAGHQEFARISKTSPKRPCYSSKLLHNLGRILLARGRTQNTTKASTLQTSARVSVMEEETVLRELSLERSRFWNQERRHSTEAPGALDDVAPPHPGARSARPIQGHWNGEMSRCSLLPSPGALRAESRVSTDQALLSCVGTKEPWWLRCKLQAP